MHFVLQCFKTRTAVKPLIRILVLSRITILFPSEWLGSGNRIENEGKYSNSETTIKDVFWWSSILHV